MMSNGTPCASAATRSPREARPGGSVRSSVAAGVLRYLRRLALAVGHAARPARARRRARLRPDRRAVPALLGEQHRAGYRPDRASRDDLPDPAAAVVRRAARGPD